MNRGSRRRLPGFSLVEMAALVVGVGFILGAVSMGRDVQRNASHQRIASDFVQGWLLAYENFVARHGVVPGDDFSSPSGRVNRGAGPVCGEPLRELMLSRGINMPKGRAEGQETRQRYRGHGGLPQDISICFDSISWSEPDADNGYLAGQRNVMTLSGLTPALASQLDHYFDGRMDARFGRFRARSLAASLQGSGALWREGDPAAEKNDAAPLQAVLRMRF